MRIYSDHIKGDYYYGKYGNLKIILNKSTGYVNVTHLCKQGKKDFKNWKRNVNTEEYINYVKQENPQIKEITIDVIGGKIKEDVEIRGTYMHHDFIPPVAAWVSRNFEYIVSKIISYIFQEEVIISLKTKLRAAQQEMSEMKRFTTVSLGNRSKEHKFVILTNKQCFFYTIRAQVGYVEKQLPCFLKEHPSMNVLVEFEYCPNGIDLYNKMKEVLDIKSTGNHFFSLIPPEELKNQIMELRKISQEPSLELLGEPENIGHPSRIERIKGEYYYGWYGNLNIIFNISTGYINVSQLCKQGGKQFKYWKRTLSAKTYMKLVQNENPDIQELTTRIKGGKLGEHFHIRGTYAHRDLIPPVAAWVSIKFKYMVSKIIDCIFYKKIHL